MAWNVFLGFEVFFTDYQTLQENKLPHKYLNEITILVVTHCEIKYSPPQLAM